jgi:hypothetical protein
MHDAIGVIAHCNAQHEGVLMQAGQLCAFSKSHHQKLRTVVEATKTSTEQKIGKETRTRRIAIADLLGSADSACECCCDFKAQKHVLASIKSAASPARVILPQQQATSLNLDFARYPLNAFDKNSVSHFPGRACPVFLFIVFLYGCERVFVASGEEIV